MVKKKAGIKKTKKKSMKVKEIIPQAPRVMQVVEVSDEETPQEKPKEVLTVTPSPPLQEEVKQESVESPAVPEGEQGESSANTEEAIADVAQKESEAKEIDQKELVSTLFKKDETFGYPEITVHKKSFLAPVIIWACLVTIVVVCLGVGIITYAKGGVNLALFAPAPTSTPTVIPEPSPTPTPEVNRKDLKIQILNGSGVKGAATDMKKLLEEKGYTISGTGNAKKYDYAVSEINFKENTSSFSAILQADIETGYAVGTVSSTLEAKVSYDAVVIVGKEKITE